jgi:hypothetical protein
MLERGLFPTGKEFVDAKAFGLGNWKEAFDAAAEYTGIGKVMVLSPWPCSLDLITYLVAFSVPHRCSKSLTIYGIIFILNSLHLTATSGLVL